MPVFVPVLFEAGHIWHEALCHRKDELQRHSSSLQQCSVGRYKRWHWFYTAVGMSYVAVAHPYSNVASKNNCAVPGLAKELNAQSGACVVWLTINCYIQKGPGKQPGVPSRIELIFSIYKHDLKTAYKKRFCGYRISIYRVMDKCTCQNCRKTEVQT